MPDKAKSTFENIVDLLKAILWPIIVLFIFFSYKTELGEIIRLIPKKIETSSKISIGSISLEIDKKARSTGNEELGGIIKTLSEKGIRRLLTLGIGRYDVIVHSKIYDNGKEGDSYTIPHDWDVLQELEKSGLLKADEPLEKFLSFFKSLHPIGKTVYLSKDDHTSTSPDETYNQKFVELTMPVSRLNADDYKRIDRFAVELSESGKLAFNIIVRVVGEQIKNE